MRPASMREKSSSVLTSFSRRRPLRCATSSAVAASAGSALVALVEQILQRAEHQRQRRAELVRHVREERRLRAVELGQRLGPAPLFLERLRVRQRRANLRRNQSEERSIVLVERAHRTDGGDEDRARLLLPGQQTPAARAPVRRHLPRAGRQCVEPCRQIGRARPLARFGHLRSDQGSAAVLGRCTELRRRRRAGVDAGGGLQLGRASTPRRDRSARTGRRAGSPPGRWPPPRTPHLRSPRPCTMPRGRAACAAAARR